MNPRPALRKAELVHALEAVPDFHAPDAALEQYRTPPEAAAEILLEAHADGAIEGRAVVDLGCGTGIFALGAVLLGASPVVGVDKDADAVQVAMEGIPDADFVVAELNDWHPDQPFDTVVMNPPFGAQQRGADRVFYDRAAEAVRDPPGGRGTAWFLAQPKTERFLAAYADDLGAGLERVAQWDYPIEARFRFHTETVQRIRVAGYCMVFR